MMTSGTEKRPLPDGWTRTTVGELGEVVTGTTPRKNEPENYGSHLPFVKPGDLDVPGLVQDATEYLSAIGAEKARILPPYSVMVTCIGSLGKAGLSGRDVATNQQINSVIPISSLDARFIYYQFLSSSFQRSLEDGASATTVAIINKTKFSKLPVILAPFPEQERIVAEIEKQFTRLDQAVASLRRLQSNLARYKASVLKAACNGRLVPQDPADEPADQLLARILAERCAQWQAANPGKKYQEPVGVVEDTAVMPDLPDGWVWATMEQLAWNASYGTSQKCSYEADGPPVLRIPNIASGQINLNDLKFAIDDSKLGDESKSVAPGDLLIIRTNGSRNLIGRAAVVKQSLEKPHYYASYLIRFRIISNPDISAWLGEIWDSIYVRHWIETTAATSAGQYNVSLSALNTLAIPIPPLAEQERIVAEVERRLSVVTAVEQTITANLSRAERLRQSILHRAFTGQL